MNAFLEFLGDSSGIPFLIYFQQGEYVHLLLDSSDAKLESTRFLELS